MASAGDIKVWARARGGPPKEQVLARIEALPDVAGRPGRVAVPFPVEDHAAYVARIKGARIFKRAEDAPVRDVPLTDLSSIQASVGRTRLIAHALDPRFTPPGTRSPENGGLVDLPVLVKADGLTYIHDGHHRATAAALRGEPTVKARVVTLPDVS